MIKLSNRQIFQAFLTGRRPISSVARDLGLDESTVKRSVREYKLRSRREGYNYRVTELTRLRQRSVRIKLIGDSENMNYEDFLNSVKWKVSYAVRVYDFSRVAEEFPEEWKYLLNEVDSDMSFGIEFEFVSTMSAADISVEIQSAVGNNRYRNEAISYHRASANHWVLCYDNSVTPTAAQRKDGFERTGRELTTPALKGREGLLELYKAALVLNKLADEGKLRVNRSCGTHIHIGTLPVSPELNLSALASKVFVAYRRNEKHFDVLVPRTRRRNNNSYIKTLSSKRPFETPRHSKVCLDHLASRGTIEFRQHSGTISFVKIVSWLILMQKLIKFSIVSISIPRAFRNFESFVSYLFRRSRNSDKFKSYFKLRMEELSDENAKRDSNIL